MKKISTLLFALMLCICASAQKNLATVINEAVTELSSKYDVVPVFLDCHEAYVLDSQVKLGSQKIAIWGGQAKVAVSGEGQIATQTYLQVRDIKFDLENANQAPVALEADADEALMTMDKYPGANQNWPHADNKINIVNCAFREVKNGIFSTNGANWAIYFLTIEGCVAQISEAIANPVLNIKGSVKNFSLINNTFYKVGAESSKVFVSFGNASNAQPQKVWGTTATAKWVVKNNTFAQTFGNKAVGDQMPSKNNITITAKKNIFYNTFRFQNKFVGNGKKDYTADDNIQCCTLESSTIESGLGNEVDSIFVMPEGPLDLDNVQALKANFGVDFAMSSFGCQKWYNAVKDNVAKAEGKDYEVVLAPDMIEMGKKDGAAKPAMSSAYPWIEDVNPTSTLDDGRAEVQQSNRWTDINPETGVQGEFLQVTGKNGSVNSPVISAQWGKYLTFAVTNTAMFEVYAAGSASGSAEDGNYVMISAVESNDATPIVEKSTPGGIYGKGTASDKVSILLDPAKKYVVSVMGAPEVNKDIQITGVALLPLESIARSAAKGGEIDGIQNVEIVNAANGVAYNIAGQRVNKSAKGIIILDGKKYINK